jgi:hypothetical protein
MKALGRALGALMVLAGEEMEQRANAVAKRMAGVRRVDNDLRVRN